MEPVTLSSRKHMYSGQIKFYKIRKLDRKIQVRIHSFGLNIGLCSFEVCEVLTATKNQEQKRLNKSNRINMYINKKKNVFLAYICESLFCSNHRRTVYTLVYTLGKPQKGEIFSTFSNSILLRLHYCRKISC